MNFMAQSRLCMMFNNTETLLDWKISAQCASKLQGFPPYSLMMELKQTKSLTLSGIVNLFLILVEY